MTFSVLFQGGYRTDRRTDQKAPGHVEDSAGGEEEQGQCLWTVHAGPFAESRGG